MATKAGELIGPIAVRARQVQLSVGGRRCTIAAGTPLAALVALRAKAGAGKVGALRIKDYGTCGRRPSTAAQLYLAGIGSDRASGPDGWIYSVGARRGTGGAADPAGPFAKGRLKSGAAVSWRWCAASTDPEGDCGDELAITSVLQQDIARADGLLQIVVTVRLRSGAGGETNGALSAPPAGTTVALRQPGGQLLAPSEDLGQGSWQFSCRPPPRVRRRSSRPGPLASRPPVGCGGRVNALVPARQAPRLGRARRWSVAGARRMRLGAGEQADAVHLRVSDDFGRRVLAEPAPPKQAGADTVMRLLQRNAKVTTRYGGGFVQSINGLSGLADSGQQVDWFYFVNGIQAGRGAADWRVRAGERIWWDRHRWELDSVSAVVGDFPEPMRSGHDRKWAGALVDCQASDRTCEEATEQLRDAGVTVREGTAEQVDSPQTRVLIGPWSAIQRRAPEATQLAGGPAVSGIFAKVGPRGVVPRFARAWHSC